MKAFINRRGMKAFIKNRLLIGTSLVILILLLSGLSFYFLKPVLKKESPKTALPGTCLILEEKYCSQAKVLEDKTPLDLTVKMVGINLPAGTPIFSPKGGQVQKTQLGADVVFFKGFRATIFNPANPNKLRYKITGDFKPDDMINTDIKEGDIIGYSQDTGIKMLGYNLIIYAFDIGEDKKESIDENAIKRLFPKAK